MHIIGVAYTMTRAIIEKHVIIDKVCVTIQLYAKYILFIYLSCYGIFFFNAY
jgi:hypothetical protein